MIFFITFINPPYGRELSLWVEKCYKENQKNKTTIVLLIPARTDTKYWHDFIFNKANKIIFIKGRINFSNSKNSAPFPSAIIVYDDSDKYEIETLHIKKVKKLFDITR